MRAYETSIGIGSCRIHPDANLIVSDEEERRVKPRIMEVLMYLAARQGRVVPADELIEALWRAPISDHAVHKAIADLRRALGDEARHPSYIRTVPRRGYCLIAELHESPEDHSPATTATPSIAVLAMSDHPSLGHLSQGIAEELAGSLSRVDGIRVASPLAASRFVGRDLDVSRIGHILNVDHVLSIGVRQEGGEVCLITALTRVDDGLRLWTRTFDRVLSDPVTVQADVACEVVGRLAGDLPTRHSGLVDLGTENVKAYEAYLLGNHEFRKHTARTIDKAIEYLKTAIELDPDFARPYGALFRCYWGLITELRVPGHLALIPEAERVLDEAVARGFTHPSPPYFLKEALHYDRMPTQRENAERALAMIRRAESEWQHYEYHLLSNCLCAAGLFHAAAAFEERYNELTGYPLGSMPYRDTCLSHLWGAQGRFDAIISLWTRAIEIHGFPAARAARATAYSRTGRHDLAAVDLEATGNVWPNSYAHFYDLYWRAGADAARSEYDDLLSRPQLDPTFRFCSQFLMEDYEAGLDTLLDFVAGSSGAPRIRAVLRWMLPPPIVTRIEAHTRFLQLMLERKLTVDWRAELIGLVNEVANVTGIYAEEEPGLMSRVPAPEKW